MAELLSEAELAIKQAFFDWLKINQGKRFNILITGKSGIGKSRLVNALIGINVAKEGRKRDACTNDVTPYEVVKEGIQILVWDSPGLQDGKCDEELYLANLKAANSKHGFDIVLYCLKMDDKRFYIEDQKAIRKLTEGFGKDLWKKAVIALTFANKIQDPDGGDESKYFMGELAEWKRKIHEILGTELDIDSKVLDTLPIVPVGNYLQQSLPSSKDWLAVLWLSCYRVLSDASAVAAWYLMSKNRLTGSAALAALSAATSSVSDSSQIAGPTSPKTVCGGIPLKINLDAEQEDTFWKWMWEAFKPTAVMMGLSAVLTVGFAILKLFK